MFNIRDLYENDITIMNTQSLALNIINNVNNIISYNGLLTTQHQIPELIKTLQRLDKKTKQLANRLTQLNNVLDIMNHLNHTLGQSVTITREVCEIRTQYRPFIDVKYTYKLDTSETVNTLLIKVGYLDNRIEFWFNPSYHRFHDKTSHWADYFSSIKCSLKKFNIKWWPRILKAIKTDGVLDRNG